LTEKTNLILIRFVFHYLFFKNRTNKLTTNITSRNNDNKIYIDVKY
jgi:hypothetical protein